MTLATRKKECLLLTLILISSASKAMADTVILKNGRALKPEEINDAEEYFPVEYGFVTAHYGNTPVERIVLDQPPPKKESLADFFFVKTAEADPSHEHDIIQSCLLAHHTIRHALHLKELKPVLSNVQYQALEDKIKAGAQEIIVLELLRNFVPQHLAVSEVRLENGKAKVVAVGKDNHETLQGLLTVVQEEGIWKLADETWLGPPLKRKSLNFETLPTVSKIKTIQRVAVASEWTPPEYTLSTNRLSLKKARLTMPKSSFFLFFFVEHNSKPKIKLKPETPPGPADAPDLHLVWTSSRRIISEQRFYKNQYPLDVSIAHEKEGYLPERLNLRLPKAKPNQIYVGVLVSF